MPICNLPTFTVSPAGLITGVMTASVSTRLASNLPLMGIIGGGFRTLREDSLYRLSVNNPRLTITFRTNSSIAVLDVKRADLPVNIGLEGRAAFNCNTIAPKLGLILSLGTNLQVPTASTVTGTLSKTPFLASPVRTSLNTVAAVLNVSMRASASLASNVTAANLTKNLVALPSGTSLLTLATSSKLGIIGGLPSNNTASLRFNVPLADLLDGAYIYGRTVTAALVSNNVDLTVIIKLTNQSVVSLKANVNGSLGLISRLQSTAGNAAALNTVPAQFGAGLRGSSALTLAVNSANMSVGLRSSTVALQLSATGLDLRYALRSLVEFKSVASFDSNGFVLLKSLLTGTAAPALSLFPVGPTKFLVLNSISGTSTLAFNAPAVINSNFVLLRTLTELNGTTTTVLGASAQNLDITFAANKVICGFNVRKPTNQQFTILPPYPPFDLFTIDLKSRAITDSSGLRMYIGLEGTSALKLQSPNTTVLNTAFKAQPITCAFSQQLANASMRIIVGLESQTTNLLTLSTIAAELEKKSSFEPIAIQTALSIPIAPPLRMMIGLQGTSTLRLSQPTPLPGMAGFTTQLESLSSCKLKLNISPVLIYINLGVADAPTQLQEFVRYPIPTGTSLATATTINGASVYPSLSVFGSQVIRVGSGVAGSTDVSIELKAYQIGQDAGNPKQKTTMVWLRASTADTNNLQRALFGSAPIGPNITKEASYASGFPRDYTTPLSSMNSAVAGDTVLTNPTNFVGSGSYSAPATSVLFLGSSLVRHNYNQSAVTVPAKNIAVATEFYGSSASPRKLTKSRVESTVPSSNSNSLSPIYSSSGFRLLTPTQYSQYGLSRTLPFKASAVVLPQDDTTAGLDAHIHGSDSMFSFIPIKSGVRHFYSYYHPTTKASNCTVTSAAFVSNQFTVGLLYSNSNPVPGDTIFVAEADCILRVLLNNYQGTSRAYIDIPVTGIGADPDTVIVDPSYRWLLEECLTSFAGTHSITCLVDYYAQPNSNPSITSSKVLALSRPIADIIGDANEFNSAKLSFAGDRNLLLGEFSVAISRPEATFTADVKINNPADELDLTIYDSTAVGNIEAKAVSFFDTDKLHLFLKTDGTLAGRRTISTFNGDKISTNLNPVLPSVVQKYISTGGTFSKVKVGESVIALLTTTNKLYLWGYNTYGHLDVPNDVDANFARTGYIDDIKDFDFHVGHIAVIKYSNNKLYGWGCKFSTSWVTPKYINTQGNTVPMTATAIKHLAIGENYSVGAVSKTINGVVTTVIEQFGSAPDAAATIDTLVLKEPTLVWNTADIKVPAGKVLACGSNHTVALKSDGTVVCWGNNNTYGQCTPPGGLANVIAVDAGDNHSMALQSDGTVVCWGRNTSGQATVPANLKAKIISAGGNFCAAIRASNSTDVTATVGAITDDEVEDTVACWGLNDVGQTVVPKCEGVSYDPDVHKYRMRFWSVKCGWNHVAGVRKDDVLAKRTRDHLELNRYAAGANRTAFKLRKDATTIFPDIGFGVSLWSDVSPNTITSNTGAAYTITIVGSAGGNYADTFVSTPTSFISGRRYRLNILSKASFSGGAALPYAIDTLKIQYATSGSPDSWIDLQFPATLLQGVSTDGSCTSNGAWPPTTCVDTNNPIVNLRNITRKWGTASTQTSWVPCIPVSDPLSFPAGSIYEIGSVATTLENIVCSFETADVYDVGLDKKYVVWGSPQAYGVSANILDYQSYYPLLTWPGEDGYTPGNLTSALNPILVKDTRVSPNATVLAYNLLSSYSYVGLGPQLGRNTEPPNYDSGNLGSFFLDDGIVGGSRIYLGPTSLQIAPLVDGLLVRVSTVNSDGDVIYYGTPALTIAGVYFNRPTPLDGSTINLYAGVESGAQESVKAIGFTNNAVYVERFTGSLPAGYSIVANASRVATYESLSGYHLQWTGSLPSIGSTTLTMTGAYCKFNELTNKADVYLPFDAVYSGGVPIPEAWLSALSLQPRLVQVVKHQLDASVLNAADPLITPVKHMTVVPRYSDSNICVGRSVYGLSINSSSTQRTDDTDPFDNFLVNPTIKFGSLNEYFPDNMYFGYRSYVSVNYSKYVVASAAQDTVGRVQTYTKTGGVNTNGQLNVKLGGPFGLTDALSPYYVQILSKSWMMDVAQWNIGHTQTPGLTYGFDKVSCSQFHTVALDMDGWVSAWGSNSAINPAATNRRPWTPYTDSGTGVVAGPNSSPHLVSGWFTNFPDANYSGSAAVSTFTANRSNTLSSDIIDPIVPLDLTVDPLASGYYDFLYPADPSTVYPTYNANFGTNGFVFFNPNKFTLAVNTEVIFVKQKLLAPSIQMGLRNDNGVYRAFIQGSYTTYLRQYSLPLDGAPSLIYFGFDESNDAIPVITGTVKVDGTYIKWDAPLDSDGFDTGTDSYISEPIYAISYSRSLNYVGTFPPPLNTDTLQRMYKPVTALTKLVAGDNFFSGLYLSEALPINKIRGTNVTTQESDFQLNLGYNKTIDGLSAQGPPNLKLLDLVGPKENYLTLVERSYKEAELINPTTGVYASTVPTIASIRLEGDNFRIFLGDIFTEGDDTVIDYTYNYLAGNKAGADVEKRVWPTVVFPGDTLFNSSYSPKEIFIYRALNLLVPGSYTSGDKFNAARYTTGYVGDQNIDAKPLVDITSSDPLKKMVCYDSVSGRVLPQGYIPEADVVGGLLSIAMGSLQTAVIKASNNKIVSWGWNHFEQRRQLRDLVTDTPTKISSSSTWSLVLDSTGVKLITSDSSGQLTVPAGLGAGTLDISTGTNFAAAIRFDGTVVCWGYETYVPEVPATLGACTKVACGGEHVLVIKADGKVACFGNNNNGQCDIPTAVDNGTVTHIACTKYMSVARLSTGVVYWWGTFDGNTGYACDATLGTNQDFVYVVKTSDHKIYSPTAQTDYNNLIANIPNVASSSWKLGQSTAARHMCAATDTTTYAWGTEYTIDGKYGAPSYVPTTASKLGVICNPLDYNIIGPYKHVVVSTELQSDVDAEYALIPPSIKARSEDSIYTSVELAGLKHAIAIAGGSKCWFAIYADNYADTQGALIAWAADPANGITTVPTGSTYTQVSSRNRHAAARKANGDIVCWGLNDGGRATVPAGIGACTKVVCGDTFTVAIKDGGLLAIWGTIAGVTATIPSPYNVISFGDISCGIDHVVGTLSVGYSPGQYTWEIGTVVAFGNNDKGQCDIPGSLSGIIGNGVQCTAVAGGYFTSYSLVTSGFALANISSTTPAAIVAVSGRALENNGFERENLVTSDYIDGYLVHYSGSICKGILPSEHPFVVAYPTTTYGSGGTSILSTTGYSPTALTSNATNIPTAYGRDGSKRAKLITAGRYTQHVWTRPDHPFGAGYTVIVDKDTNAIQMVGGDALPGSCSVLSYSPPIEKSKLYDVPTLQLGDANIIQIGTFRGNTFALTSTGAVVQWGYQDSSVSYDISDPGLKQYIAVPDIALDDNTPSLTGARAFALAYVSGAPGLSDSWYVNVNLDRYVDGVKTNVRRFTATGNTEGYSIAKPVHFAETFLAVDNWPSDSTRLDSQYVLSIDPNGVACDINTASIFGMNLDSKSAIGPVLKDASNMSANMSEVADYMLATTEDDTLATNTLTVASNALTVNTVSEALAGVSFTSNELVVKGSYVRNKYGSSAIVESTPGGGLGGLLAGRVPYLAPVTPATMPSATNLVAWYKSDTLPASGEVTTWTNSVSGSSVAALTQTGATLKPAIVAFNSTTYNGAQFDSTASAVDFLSSTNTNIGETEFTYFVVYNKTASTTTHLDFGKLYTIAGSTRGVQGIGWIAGRPTLYTKASDRYKANSATAVTGNGILCGYYRGSDLGLRLNGTAVPSTLETNETIGSTLPTGYHLEARVVANPHDVNDVCAEVVAFNGSLTDLQIQQVEGYLAHKFNLASSLPNEHPYKTSPAVGEKLDVITPTDTTSNLILKETNRFTSNTGQAQTWVGMFEVGLNHVAQRKTAGGSVYDDISPVVAEFNIKTNQTLSILTIPVIAKFNSIAADLSVGASVKYLDGKVFGKFAISSADMFVGLVIGQSKVTPKLRITPAGLDLIMGMEGAPVLSSLKFFSGADCGFYGCLSVSLDPPSLTILQDSNYGTITTQFGIAPVIMDKTVNMKGKVVRLTLNAPAAELNVLRAMSSSVTCVLRTSARIHNATVYLEPVTISPRLRLEVCVASFAFLNLPKKKYGKENPVMPTYIIDGIIPFDDR